VLGYDESIRQPLQSVLKRLNPQQIGLNYSTDNPTADGLTHGMWLTLNELLRDTPYASRLTSAAPLLAKLHGRKSPAEVERMRGAIKTTEAIVDLVARQIRPGVSEVELADFVHEQFRARGLISAWEWDACPIVNIGPASEAGHGKPQAHIRLEPGHLVHID